MDGGCGRFDLTRYDFSCGPLLHFIVLCGHLVHLFGMFDGMKGMGYLLGVPVIFSKLLLANCQCLK